MLTGIKNFFSWILLLVMTGGTLVSPLPNATSSPSLDNPKSAEPTITLTSSPPLKTPTTIPTNSPTPKPIVTKKNTYVIALLGDSMMDTLGPDAPQLHTKLKLRYPNTTFTLINFGVGATDIEYGINRITNGYEYLGKQFPSLVSTKPDIVVVESFAYNPFLDDNGSSDKHWLAFARVVDTIKLNIPQAKIVIAATIAPDADTFGDGAPGISFSREDKISRTNTIKRYLLNAIRFAQSQKIPLADAYTASLDANGDGKIAYINAGDHIHYSVAGRELITRKIAEAIAANHLLE